MQVRDAFRRFMAAEPAAWDYSSSDIPSALTEEMESAQQSKKVRTVCIMACCVSGSSFNTERLVVPQKEYEKGR
jgi:hypothetical protein